MTFLQEIQKDLEKKNLKPENFKDPIIFMSMFNDIKWKKNDENCISNAEKVKNYAKSFLPGHWTFLGPGLEKRWYGDSHGGQWDRTANKTVQQFDKIGHPIFPSTSALSRGFLKQRKGKSTIHFSGDSVNSELLFQTDHSVSQISVYAAVTDWCRVAIPLDNRVLSIRLLHLVEFGLRFPLRQDAGIRLFHFIVSCVPSFPIFGSLRYPASCLQVLD